MEYFMYSTIHNNMHARSRIFHMMYGSLPISLSLAQLESTRNQNRPTAVWTKLSEVSRDSSKLEVLSNHGQRLNRILLLVLIPFTGNIQYYDAKHSTMILNTCELVPIGNFSVRAGRKKKEKTVCKTIELLH